MTCLVSGGDQGEPGEGSAHPKLRATIDPVENVINWREMMQGAVLPKDMAKETELPLDDTQSGEKMIAGDVQAGTEQVI